MKKIKLLLYCFLLAASPVFSQTQAEIDAMMKKAMAEIEKAKNDPKNKDQANNLPNMDSIMKLVNANKPPGGRVTKAVPSNKVLLNALPIRPFNKAELISYIKNLNIKLTEVALKHYKKTITDITGIAIKKTGTSVALWLNGEPERAALAALKAAELYPDNATLLNNAAGILTSSGLSVNAIPILQYVLQTNPDNNTVLNNLGQAYLDLEEDSRAETYFLMAVRSYNYHPDANQALAIISEKKGDKAAAIKYAENSLKGAYRTETYNLLQKLKPGGLKLMDLIRHRYKQPEHFNIHKYPLLPQCMNVNTAIVLKQQHDAYNQMLRDLEVKYEKLRAIESRIVEETGVQIMMARVKANRSPLKPFGEFATTILVELAEEYIDKFILFDKYKQTYNTEKKRLRAIYDAEIKAIANAGGGCSAKNAAANQYLSQCAILQTDYQLKALPLYKNYLNDWSFWSYMASYDDHLYKSIFYQLVQSMFLVLKEVNHTEIILPCSGTELEDGIADALEIEEPDCPFPAKVIIPLGFIKLEWSCDSYKLEGGEGIIGKIEYDRKSGDITLAFGLGGALPKAAFKVLGADVGVEMEAKGQFYITFDNSGKPTDLGVVWEAEMKLLAKVGEAGVEFTLEEDELKVGFGNGVTMKDGGSFKAFIDHMYPVQPDAKQINKSVPLYPKQNG